MERISRRRFIGSSATRVGTLTAAASALASLRPGRAFGANEKVVLALIGAGGRGRDLARKMAAIENVEFKYVCDVESGRAAGGLRDVEKLQGSRPKQIVDMREALDDKDVRAVVVATPEHWHALATVWACQAGKDVYVEKNVSLTIWEGRKMIEAARKYKRIVQCGTQNRSAPYAVSARDYIQSGKLGKVVHVKAFNMLGGRRWGPSRDGKPPAGFDWDRWLGPAPERPYNRGRHRGWAAWWDYCGGSLSGDASHTLDLARLVIGDPPHPQAVYCAGGNLAFGSPREAPEMQAITYDFGSFTMTCENTAFPPYMKKTRGDIRYGNKFPHWPQNATRIEIYGTKQMMYVGRHGGGWQAFAAAAKEAAHDYGYHPDKWHQPSFIDCIRTRKRPNGNIEQGHYSATLIHLANLAYRVGNKHLLFDGKTESFTNNDDANRLLTPQYRKQYRIPEEV